MTRTCDKKKRTPVWKLSTGAGRALSGPSRIFNNNLLHAVTPCFPFLHQVLVVVDHMRHIRAVMNLCYFFPPWFRRKNSHCLFCRLAPLHYWRQ